jgi:predicted amidohydrolase
VTRLVLRGARHPGDVAIEDGRIVAVGDVPSSRVTRSAASTATS